MDRTTIYRRYDNNQIEINLLYKNTTDTLPDDFNVTEHYDNAKTQINEDITSTGTILEEDKENFIDEIFENTENEFITLNINDSIKRPITLYSWKNIITDSGTDILGGFKFLEDFSYDISTKMFEINLNTGNISNITLGEEPETFKPIWLTPQN